MAARKRLPRGAVGASEGKLDEKHFLGRLATFTFPEAYIPGTKLIRSVSKHGLDVDDWPKVREPVHSFQSACRSVDTRKYGLAKRSGRRGKNGVEVKVDEVLHNPNECVYQVTRMVRDDEERVIEHPKAMRVTFDKRTAQIAVDELEDYAKLRELEEQIRTHFDKHQKAIHSQKIRNAVGATLRKLGGQNLKRNAGGLYFVPTTYRVRGAGDRWKDVPTKPVLDGLRGLLEDLYGDEADFWTIPLVNDEGQREMVRKHFTINANEQAREMLERAVQRLRAGRGERFRTEFITNLWNERRKLQGAVDQFDELVGIERAEIEANLRDLDEKLGELQDLAESKGGA